MSYVKTVRHFTCESNRAFLRTDQRLYDGVVGSCSIHVIPNKNDLVQTSSCLSNQSTTQVLSARP